ncbi:Hemicentin-2, partial [Stegodyphus mimosarum]
MEKINVLKNSSVILDCTAEGHPEPILIWRKNQQVISSAVNSAFKYENSKNILHINYLQESDGGIYSCVAMNKVGSVTR